MEKIKRAKEPEEIFRDFERYREYALNSGAANAEIIKAIQVRSDERAKMKCRVPRCTYYGECANCPPFSPDVDEMNRLISKYKYAILVRHDVTPVEDFTDRKRLITQGAKHYKKLGKIVSQIESMAFQDGYYFALAFAGGCCKHYLCDDHFCQYLDSKKCRYNLLARPSMESVGIDVFDLVTSVGWDIYPIGSTHAVPDISCASVVGIVFIS